MDALKPWSVHAINLPEHADNPVHTDDGARKMGFPRALVAGVSVYAYLTHPAVAAWGEAWVSGGGGEVRFRQPVFENDLVVCGAVDNTLEARVEGDVRATFAVWQADNPPDMRDGERLPIREFLLDEDRATYGLRAGDDLALYLDRGIAHPALWPHTANRIFADHLVTGPWVHTRSKIFHQGVARTGDTIRVESFVVDRFATRSGERALVDMAIFANDKPVVQIEHEALVSLRASPSNG